MPDSASTQSVVLEPLQVQAANLLAAGDGYSEVCQRLGVGRTTLYRWRQIPDFAAYLNQLLRQAADEATARSLRLVQEAQNLINQQINDPSTPMKLRLSLALRVISQYSRPNHLRYVQSLPEDPEVISLTQARQAAIANGLDPDKLDGSDAELFQCYQADRIKKAKAFDALYPDPAPVLTDIKWNTMKQNGTSTDSAHAA